MEENIIKYIAGLFDSEGNIRMSLKKNKKTLSCEASIGMTDLVIIEMVAKFFNRSINTDSRENKKNRKPLYSVTFGPKTGIIEFLNTIIPYLNEKRKLARLVLKYLELDEQNKISNTDIFLKEYRDIFHYTSLEDESTIMSPAYIAGIIDGDGCITCVFNNKKRNPSIRITLEQCYKDVSGSLSNIYGGNIYIRKSKKPNHRDKQAWTITKDDSIILFLNTIKDFLILKKERAIRSLHILNYRKGLDLFGRDRNVEFVRFLREEIDYNDLYNKSNQFYKEYVKI